MIPHTDTNQANFPFQLKARVRVTNSYTPQFSAADGFVVTLPQTKVIGDILGYVNVSASKTCPLTGSVACIQVYDRDAREEMNYLSLTVTVTPGIYTNFSLKWTNIVLI